MIWRRTDGERDLGTFHYQDRGNAGIPRTAQPVSKVVRHPVNKVLIQAVNNVVRQTVNTVVRQHIPHIRTTGANKAYSPTVL